MTNKKLSEFELIDKLTCNLPGYSKSVIVGVGDDCAVLKYTASKYSLVTCDVQVEGVHFLPNVKNPQEIGQKAIAVNVSDIAAMGGQPTFCLVSLIIPKNIKTEYIDSIYDGIKSSCGQFNIQIIGGNMSSGVQLTIDIFMMGEVKRDELLLRSGAKPGDKVLVTGKLGAAAAGVVAKQHIVPCPRLEESKIIAKSKLATSMIDISDGLQSDIGHLCDKSDVGVMIYESQIPSPDGLDFALNGGEDYELLFTVPAGASNKIIKLIQSESNTPVTIIGEILPKNDGRWVQSSNGKNRKLEPAGWDHFSN